ncbi:MAG: flagellar biosynthesis anti-sigma factor FlgM [Gammaproteobacteria bacterium]|nr:flagellar biosynthesis anti-sigma factor FlgM [Gammaproteobacteria bacterium]MBQ0839502.1 flagellar biosynthesis anti-sigma factor FlgM [Gammaproteobacteria bacterium]
MEIIRQPATSNTGLSTSTEKKADASHGVASGTASTPQQAGESSTVTVTDSALKLLQIEKTLAEMPGFDTEKVESIKQALSDGSYTINTDRIAEKLISFEQDIA